MYFECVQTETCICIKKEKNTLPVRQFKPNSDYFKTAKNGLPQGAFFLH